MRIEIKERGTKEFYEEVVNVTFRYKRLIRNPKAKLPSDLTSMRNITVLAVILFFVNLYTGYKGTFEPVVIAAMVTTAIVAIAAGALLMTLRRRVNEYLSDQRPSVVTLDRKGVEIDREGAQTVRLAWKNVAFVRSFEKSTCFLSKDVTGLVLAVTNRHREEIMAYLKKNHIDVKVIERTSQKTRTGR